MPLNNLNACGGPFSWDCAGRAPPRTSGDRAGSLNTLRLWCPMPSVVAHARPPVSLTLLERPFRDGEEAFL